MLNSFKLAMIEEKEQQIRNAHYVVNEDNARLCWSIGCQMKYVLLANPLEVAEHFKVHRIIDWFETDGNGIKMFKLAIIKTGNGEIERKYPVTLKDLKGDLNPSVALTHAAIAELPVKDRLDAIAWYFIKQTYKVYRHILSIRMII